VEEVGAEGDAAADRGVRSALVSASWMDGAATCFVPGSEVPGIRDAIVHYTGMKRC
jgi:hypothetical protein